jgi:hypothetical protein
MPNGGTSPSSERTDFSEPTSEKPNLSTWLTKQQAADAIGVSTKTIEAFAKDRKIQQAAWRPQNRGPEKAVYHPDDVARLASARRPGLQPFVLPASTAGNGNGHGSLTKTAASVAIRQSEADDPIRQFFDRLMQVLQSPALPPASEKSSEKAAYVDKAEALAIAGVSYGALRAAVQAGEVKQRGRRYRRRDLEAL